MIAVSCEDSRVFSFEPSKTALLSIDFQRDFLDPQGGCCVNDPGKNRLTTIIPAAQNVLRAARKAGLTVIHTREVYNADLSDVTTLKKEMGYVGRQGPLGRNLIKGEPGCEIIEELRPKEGELVIDKPGFSAFYKTDLEDHLKSKGITHLVIIGVTYQCCVHSTLRDAVERGYYALTLDDACAALTPELEEATRALIRSENNLFGWIAESKTFCKTLTL